MYKEISNISFFIRFYLAYLTIEQYPIFANPGLDWLLGQIISIYTILWFISYTITGRFIYKNDISDSSGRVMVYFVVYLPFLTITYGILYLLTKIHILPF